MATTKPTKYGRGIYPTYHFRDHDPIIDTVLALKKTAGATWAQIKRATNTDAARNWGRKTKRPQYATVAAVINYLGGEISVSYPETTAASLKALQGGSSSHAEARRNGRG